MLSLCTNDITSFIACNMVLVVDSLHCLGEGCMMALEDSRV